jgi:hypothetical protein
MDVDQRYFWIPVTILGVIVAVAILEALISALRQALRIKRRTDAMQATLKGIDTEQFERDLARIAGSAIVGQALASRATVAIRTIRDALFDWKATVTRVRVLRDRARTLPEILNEG